MENEEKFVGYSFMYRGDDHFDGVYNSEREAIQAAKNLINENSSAFIAIVGVKEINLEAVAKNALDNAIEYVREFYSDFEAGIDDGVVVHNPEIYNILVPQLCDNIDFTGITQKGEILYEYDLVNNRQI